MKPVAVAGLLALAACQQPATSNSNVSPTVNRNDTGVQPDAAFSTDSAALPAPELKGVTTTSGSWKLLESGSGDQAVFKLAGNSVAFSLRCDRKVRQIIFVRAGTDENGGTLQLIVADGAATFPAEEVSHGNIRAIDLVTDTFVTHVLAEAKGQIGVRIGHGTTFAMPSDPVIGLVIKRCAAP